MYLTPGIRHKVTGTIKFLRALLQLSEKCGENHPEMLIFDEYRYYD